MCVYIYYKAVHYHFKLLYYRFQLDYYFYVITIFSSEVSFTSLGDIVHGVVFVISHESKYWEDDEAGVETRQAVDQGNKQGIPEIKQ